jgi:hypothetical protein
MNGQNLANEISEIDAAVKAATPQPLTMQQQAWIDYNALSGLITDMTTDAINKNGQAATMRKMPITEFAELVGVSRETLRLWRNSIPNFWDKVNDRRRQLAPQSRLQRVHEAWYLKAVKGDFQHMQLWLANFDPNFHMPTEKHDIDVGGGLADLLKLAQTRVKADAIPEAEVIDAGNKAA